MANTARFTALSSWFREGKGVIFGLNGQKAYADDVKVGYVKGVGKRGKCKFNFSHKNGVTYHINMSFQTIWFHPCSFVVFT
ncbi:MAG: hypothetical protein H6Q26_2191 [Bacteroidetes bacterium]|nr:hypothetical protein [Bacteroidota bacterium]